MYKLYICSKFKRMQFLLFIFLYPILWLISILPFKLLYLFSDFVYLIIYKIFGYRKKVVRDNLAKALPHLSDKERLIIEKKSYHHLCDIFVEMIKTMTISKEEMSKRYVFTNIETYLDLEKKGKSIALLCAHYASYEWMISMNHHITFQGYGIYKKISNRYFDKLVKDIRSKFKAHLITTRETKKTIEKNKELGILGVFGFASDQIPSNKNTLYYSNFMGIKTPIHYGAESLAKVYDMNVIFVRGKKIKRGYYEATFEVLFEDVRTVPNYQVSELFMKKVEKQILEAPEFYLWTHKRWKNLE